MTRDSHKSRQGAQSAGRVRPTYHASGGTPHGFTLLEVLVALAILAVALAASLRATGIAASSSEGLRDRLAATWVAQNRLALHQAQRDWPKPGNSGGEAELGGMRFQWQEVVSDTPNPRFRRLEVKVFVPGRLDAPLAQLTGYAVNEAVAPTASGSSAGG